MIPINNQLFSLYKNIFRNIEKAATKCVNLKSAIKFNRTCLNNGVYPTYVKIKLRGRAVTNNEHAEELQKEELSKEITNKTIELEETEIYLNNLKEELKSTADEDLYKSFTDKITEIVQNTTHNLDRKHIEKLNRLYNGRMYVAENSDKFINLSTHQFTQEERDVLNLGLNCHIQRKIDPIKKKMDIEILYQNLTQMEKDGKITIKPEISDALRNEGNKIRSNNHTKLLTKTQRTACKLLKENQNIIIRKADKSNIYVILNKENYKNKLDEILGDETKFRVLQDDPSLKLKDKLNKLIVANNALANNKKLPKLVGEYHAGYIYGNSKIHKNANDPPLRPIISQIPAPTYTIAKEINKIIEPYLPTKYILKSTDELLDLIRVQQPQGILASLDVESLYTNVPIQETIEIILNHVYSTDTAPPKIQRSTLKQLLEICTQEAPFKHIDGSFYQQIDGIAMGSPLGCIFANFYMATIESKSLENCTNKPTLYARYIDDILLIVNDEEQLLDIKTKFQDNSVLNFTHEIGFNKLPFLDVLIEFNNDNINTSVYTKITNTGELLNYNSECPEKYKTGVIMNMLHRGRKISSTMEAFKLEIDRLKQVFTNNNFPIKLIDKCIEEFRTKQNNQNILEDPKNKLKIYYENQMNDQYKKDEKVIKAIINNNVKPTTVNDELEIIIYYKNMKTKNLIMKNDITRISDKLSKSWIVYKYNCPREDCELPNPTYIGQTRNTLKKRLEQHCNDGAIKEHLHKNHKLTTTQDDLELNTIPVKQFTDTNRLFIYEALLILHERPDLNRQKDNFINPLKLYARSTPRHNNTNNSQAPTAPQHTHNLRRRNTTPSQNNQ